MLLLGFRDLRERGKDENIEHRPAHLQQNSEGQGVETTSMLLTHDEQGLHAGES